MTPPEGRGAVAIPATCWEELKRWVGFDEQAERLLAALAPVVEPHVPQLAADFLARARSLEATAGLIEDEASAARLERAISGWIRGLLQGPRDEAYHARLQRIGRVHVRVGLSERYAVAAIGALRSSLARIASGGLPAGQAGPTIAALHLALDLELAVMAESYREAHEASELRTLQDLVVRNMPVTILCLDAGGLVTAATRPAARLFGQGATIGAHFQEFLPEALIEATDLPTLVGQALDTGREVTVPFVRTGRGEQARTFHVGVVPLDHPLARVLVHIEELSDVLRAEARASRAESLARLGALAANVAHEIRNPLAAISSTLQVIAASLDEDDRRRSILAKVQQQVLRLNRLVTDLLGYGRPVQPRTRRLCLAQVAAEAIAASGVRASVERHGEAAALADPELLQHILVNLLQNADAAAPEGPVVVRVGPGPRVSVVDEGPGVCKEVERRIFQPFVTTKARGTGLGLAICRKLALAMHGEITWSPTHPERIGPGRGATFELELPAVSGDGSDRTSPAGSEARSG